MLSKRGHLYPTPVQICPDPRFPVTPDPREDLAVTGDHPTRHVRLEDNGRVVASAEVRTPEEGAARASFHIEPGHLPPGTGSALVDAVLDAADTRPGDRLTASAPLGDAEILHRVHDRYTDVTTRSAGATLLIDATGCTDAEPTPTTP